MKNPTSRACDALAAADAACMQYFGPSPVFVRATTPSGAMPDSEARSGESHGAPVVVSYEWTRPDGARVKITIEHGQAWTMREWPQRLESCEARALTPVEQQMLELCRSAVKSGHG